MDSPSLDSEDHVPNIMRREKIHPYSLYKCPDGPGHRRIASTLRCRDKQARGSKDRPCPVSRTPPLGRSDNEQLTVRWAKPPSVDGIWACGRPLHQSHFCNLHLIHFPALTGHKREPTERGKRASGKSTSRAFFPPVSGVQRTPPPQAPFSPQRTFGPF